MSRSLQIPRNPILVSLTGEIIDCLAEYARLAPALGEISPGVAVLTQQSDVGHFARSSTYPVYGGSNEVARLTLAAFAIGDGTGRETPEYNCSNLDMGKYGLLAKKAVPKSNDGIFAATHFPILEAVVKDDEVVEVDKFGGVLKLLGFDCPSSRTVSCLGELKANESGSDRRKFTYTVAPKEDPETFVFTRFGDPHSVVYAPETEGQNRGQTIVVAGFLAVTKKAQRHSGNILQYLRAEFPE